MQLIGHHLFCWIKPFFFNTKPNLFNLFSIFAWLINCNTIGYYAGNDTDDCSIECSIAKEIRAQYSSATTVVFMDIQGGRTAK